MKKKKRILAIGDIDSLAEIGRVLRRAEFEMRRVPTALAAAQMVHRIAFDLIIVVHPLVDTDFATFHHEVRDEGSPCCYSRLLVLSSSSRLAELEEFARDSRLEPVDLDQPSQTLAEITARYLGPVRVAERFPLSLRAVWPSIGESRTLNVSASGVLIARDTGELPPLGERAELELSPHPGDPPVWLPAEVVRHIEAGEGARRGFVASWVALPAAELQWLDGLLAAVDERALTAEWPLPRKPGGEPSFE